MIDRAFTAAPPLITLLKLEGKPETLAYDE